MISTRTQRTHHFAVQARLIILDDADNDGIPNEDDICPDDPDNICCPDGVSCGTGGTCTVTLLERR